ncbi:protein of unknown function [Tenacibaculum sp. 190524A02b]|uniref:hypothetical protein n=1 Tax=Tenacibaculum vairaonense TaxID=3137860 RepID=UPI0032B14FFE
MDMYKDAVVGIIEILENTDSELKKVTVFEEAGGYIEVEYKELKATFINTYF